MRMRPFVTLRKKVPPARASDAHMPSSFGTRQNTGLQKRIGWIRAALLNINSEFPVAPSNNEGSDAPFGNRLMPDEPL